MISRICILSDTKTYTSDSTFPFGHMDLEYILVFDEAFEKYSKTIRNSDAIFDDRIL